MIFFSFLFFSEIKLQRIEESWIWVFSVACLAVSSSVSLRTPLVTLAVYWPMRSTRCSGVSTWEKVRKEGARERRAVMALR